MNDSQHSVHRETESSDDIQARLDRIEESLLGELGNDARLQSGVPESLKGSDVDFIQMSGLTLPGEQQVRAPYDVDAERPDLDKSAPISFYEKGVADVDGEMAMGGLEEEPSAREDILPPSSDDALSMDEHLTERPSEDAAYDFSTESPRDDTLTIDEPMEPEPEPDVEPSDVVYDVGEQNTDLARGGSGVVFGPDEDLSSMMDQGEFEESAEMIDAAGVSDEAFELAQSLADSGTLADDDLEDTQSSMDRADEALEDEDDLIYSMESPDESISTEALELATALANDGKLPNDDETPNEPDEVTTGISDEARELAESLAETASLSEEEEPDEDEIEGGVSDEAFELAENLAETGVLPDDTDDVIGHLAEEESESFDEVTAALLDADDAIESSEEILSESDLAAQSVEPDTAEEPDAFTQLSDEVAEAAAELAAMSEEFSTSNEDAESLESSWDTLLTDEEESSADTISSPETAAYTEPTEEELEPSEDSEQSFEAETPELAAVEPEEDSLTELLDELADLVKPRDELEQLEREVIQSDTSVTESLDETISDDMAHPVEADMSFEPEPESEVDSLAALMAELSDDDESEEEPYELGVAAEDTEARAADALDELPSDDHELLGEEAMPPEPERELEEDSFAALLDEAPDSEEFGDESSVPGPDADEPLAPSVEPEHDENEFEAPQVAPEPEAVDDIDTSSETSLDTEEESPESGLESMPLTVSDEVPDAEVEPESAAAIPGEAVTSEQLFADEDLLATLAMTAGAVVDETEPPAAEDEASLVSESEAFEDATETEPCPPEEAAAELKTYDKFVELFMERDLTPDVDAAQAEKTSKEALDLTDIASLLAEAEKETPEELAATEPADEPDETALEVDDLDAFITSVQIESSDSWSEAPITADTTSDDILDLTEEDLLDEVASVENSDSAGLSIDSDDVVPPDEQDQSDEADEQDETAVDLDDLDAMLAAPKSEEPAVVETDTDLMEDAALDEMDEYDNYVAAERPPSSPDLAKAEALIQELEGQAWREATAEVSSFEVVAATESTPVEAVPPTQLRGETDATVYQQEHQQGHRRKSSRGRRALRRLARSLFLLVLLGGIGAAGYIAWQQFASRLVSPEKQWATAQNAAADGNYDEAANRFAAFAKQNPTSPQRATAQFNAAFYLYLSLSDAPVSGKADELLLSRLSDFINDNPSHPKIPRARILQASVLVKLKRYDEALAILTDRSIRFHDPAMRLVGLRMMAEIYADRRDYRSAKATYLQAASLSDNLTPDQDYTNLGNLAQVLYLQTKGTPEAQTYFDDAITYWERAARDPGMADADRDDLQRAITNLRESVLPEPGLTESQPSDAVPMPQQEAGDASAMDVSPVYEPEPEDEAAFIEQQMTPRETPTPNVDGSGHDVTSVEGD